MRNPSWPRWTTLAGIVVMPTGDLDAVYVDIRAVAEIAACEEARLTVALEIPTLEDHQSGDVCVAGALAGAKAAALTTGHGR